MVLCIQRKQKFSACSSGEHENTYHHRCIHKQSRIQLITGVAHSVYEWWDLRVSP